MVEDTQNPADSGSPPASPPEDDSASRPTPVRQAVGRVTPVGDETPASDDDPVSLEVDGARWSVRVLGRSRGGPASAPTHLLLLGFTPEDGAGGSLETLVVGRTLAGLSEADLMEAHERATPPPDADRAKTLFAAATERRGRRG